MDTDVTKRLVKGLYAQKKRKRKAPGEGLKWVKVSASNPMAPTTANVAPESGHHMLAHLKRENCLKVEMLNVWEGLQAKINHLQTMAVEAEHLTREKIVKNESLHSALRKKEFISIGLKVVLALEEKRRQEAEGRVASLEAQMSKSISEVAAQAMEEFKISLEMKNLNIAFAQQAFIKSVELYEGRVVQRFSKLDLEFLEEDNAEARPSEPATKAPKPVQEFEAAETAPASSTTIPPPPPGRG
ncbi:hypothetical protein COCNU_scaffold007842G000010 [Cocos nucifera]|nr:hypothetical protein [Cocos nucifera]